MSEWTFLTNHAHVLLCITEDNNARLRDLAERVEISERAVKRIVADLEHTGYISRKRFGRRNRYEVYLSQPMRGPVPRSLEIGALLAVMVPLVAQSL
jgi:DNA-binding Lrp family transcriptional regulator